MVSILTKRFASIAAPTGTRAGYGQPVKGRRNMMASHFRTCVRALVATFVLVACSGGNDDPAEGGNQPSVPLTPKGWNLVWSDEFGGALDTSKWNIQTGDGTAEGIPGWGNNELQSYQADNISVADGNLIITARQEEADGRAHTSGRIDTAGKLDRGTCAVGFFAGPRRTSPDCGWLPSNQRLGEVCGGATDGQTGRYGVFTVSKCEPFLLRRLGVSTGRWGGNLGFEAREVGKRPKCRVSWGKEKIHRPQALCFSGSQNSASGSGHAIRPHRGEHPRCRRPGAMVRVLDAAHRFGLWHLGRRRRDRHHGRVLARPEPLHPGRGALRHGAAAQHLQLREAHGGGSGRRLPHLRPGVGRAGDPLVRGRDALPYRQELDLLELLQGGRDERARRRLRLGAVRPAVAPAAQSRGGRELPGAPTPDALPGELLVDYVRVYECTIDTETGTGCDGFTDYTDPSSRRRRPTRFSARSTTSTSMRSGHLRSRTPKTAWHSTSASTTRGAALALSEVDAGARGMVIDVRTTGGGNFSIFPANLARQTLFGMGGASDPGSYAGEVQFDLYIFDDETDAASSLQVKLDSGFPDLGFVDLLVATLTKDAWTTITVQISDIAHNAGNFGGGPVDLAQVLSLFVLEPTSFAHVRVDNIRIICGHVGKGDCGIAPPAPPPPAAGEPQPVYIDAVDPIWDVGIIAADSGSGSGFANYGDGTIPDNKVQWEEIAADDPARGQILEVSFSDSEAFGVWFIQSSMGMDLSAYAPGVVSFDIKVDDYGDNDAGMTMKIDCIFPCSSGDQSIGKVGDDDWETVEVPVAQLLGGGLNLATGQYRHRHIPDEPEQRPHLPTRQRPVAAGRWAERWRWRRCRRTVRRQRCGRLVPVGLLRRRHLRRG